MELEDWKHKPQAFHFTKQKQLNIHYKASTCTYEKSVKV